MRESDIEKHLRLRTVERGWVIRKFTSPGHRGVPDRIILPGEGLVFFVECKSTYGTIDPLQTLEANVLRHFGYDVFLIRSKAQADQCLEKISRLIPTKKIS